MGCLLISGHTGLFQLYISDCGSKVLVLVGLRQVFLWETQETNIAGDAGMTDIVLVSNKFHFPVQSKLPHSFHTYMKNEVSWIDFNFSFIQFVLFFAFQLLYTCQLSCLRRESHACGLKTSISRLRANFSRLIEKCELLPSCLTQFPKIR